MKTKQITKRCFFFNSLLMYNVTRVLLKLLHDSYSRIEKMSWSIFENIVFSLVFLTLSQVFQSFFIRENNPWCTYQKICKFLKIRCLPFLLRKVFFSSKKLFIERNIIWKTPEIHTLHNNTVKRTIIRNKKVLHVPITYCTLC